MNKTSTAVYLLIAILVIILAIVMAKPVLTDATGKATYELKLFNFTALKA